MPSTARGNAYVLSENRWPQLGRYWYEVDPVSTSVTDHRFAVCSLDILHPIGIGTKHRYEVTLSLYGWNHQGI